MLRSLTADDGPGAELKVPDSGTVVVGRAPLADLPLPDHNSVKGLISRKHVSMQLLADGSIAVTDLGSLNGTWVTAAGQHKPQRLQAHVTTAVAPGSTLYFGGHEVVADAEGGRCPNPFVYLYLGPSGGAQQQVGHHCSTTTTSAAASLTLHLHKVCCISHCTQQQAVCLVMTCG